MDHRQSSASPTPRAKGMASRDPVSQSQQSGPSPRWAWLLGGAALLAVLALLLTPRIGQDPAYHQFANQRMLLGIPNFWDVVTSVPLSLAGLLGLRAALAADLRGGLPELRVCYQVFFIGLALIGPGSIWYHLDPDIHTLLWDRLPMAVAFMAMLAILLGEKVSPVLARHLFWPLVAAGLASVLYWYWSERAGHGDLRPYALVQLAPMLALPVLLLLGRPMLSGDRWLWAMFALYGLAKVLEMFDSDIHALLGIGGHAFKHLAAAAAGACLALALDRRRRL